MARAQKFCKRCIHAWYEQAGILIGVRHHLVRKTTEYLEDGRIIVLSPAHQFLFTPFDAAIGHFRRYNAGMLRSLTPACMQMEKVFYLDSVGMILSFANRMLLRQSMSTAQQLSFWDRYVIPISRITDPLLLGSLGKTIVAVWKKKRSPEDIR